MYRVVSSLADYEWVQLVILLSLKRFHVTVNNLLKNNLVKKLLLWNLFPYFIPKNLDTA